MSFVDPPPPPEASGMRAKDLLNKVVVLRPTGAGTDPDKIDDKGKPWSWVECDVWVIDRAGIAEHAEQVRFSWWKVREQLAGLEQKFVAGKVVEGEDKSRFLVPLQDEARKVVTAAMSTIAGTAPVEFADDDTEEPF